MKLKQKGQLIGGLDLGTSWVRMAVAQRTKDGGIQIIGAAEAPSIGVHKGIVTSIEDAVSSVSACLEKVERIVGAPLEHVWVGISGSHITTQESKGVIAVAKANNEISEEDVARAIDAARTVATPLNHEILHVIPQSYSVDGQVGIKDPVGMTGVRLEVDTRIIQGITSHIKNLTKAVYRTGLDIDNLVLTILASADAVLTEKQKDLGVAVVNIGASTTSLAVFEDGNLLHTMVLPLGGINVTSDIAVGLRIDVEIAERVKLHFGEAMSKNIAKKDEFNLAELGASQDEFFSKKLVADIIEARVEEIFVLADKELKRIGRSAMLPGGIVLTGGGAKLPGIIELAKKVFKLPASLGTAIEMESITDKINDLAFSPVMGLVRWGHNSIVEYEAKGGNGLMSGISVVENTRKKLRDWIKSMLP